MSTEATPTRRALRIRKASEKTGFSESTIWRLVGQGEFPAPVKLSPGCTAWFEHEIDAWLNEKSLKRDAVPQCVRN